jgi:hypothetical protein
MSEFSVILGAIAEMNQAHKDCVSALKEEMRIGLRSSAVQIEAEMEIVNSRIQGLSDHVAEQNSNVFKLKQESENRKVVVEDFRKLEKRVQGREIWVKKRWVAILALFIISVAVIVVVVEIVGVKVVIEKAWEKVP